MAMSLEQIMTYQVVTVNMDDTLETVQQLFERFHFHHLLVLGEGDVLAGVVSDRDFLKSLSPFISTLIERPEDLRTLKRRVHQIMSHHPITASRNDSIKEAAVLMLAHRISCLPIVRSDGTIEGIVTWKDILKWLIEQMNMQK
jgi:acetoin utilization protein AcuB